MDMLKWLLGRRPPAEKRTLPDDLKWAAGTMALVLIAFFTFEHRPSLIIGCLIGVSVAVSRAEIARRRFRR
jgi:hypothetical protein